VKKEEEALSELRSMAELLPGDWRVWTTAEPEEPAAEYTYYAGLCLADGKKVASTAKGRTKAEALENLLGVLRDGKGEPAGVPAAGSAAELELRLAAEGRL